MGLVTLLVVLKHLPHMISSYSLQAILRQVHRMTPKNNLNTKLKFQISKSQKITLWLRTVTGIILKKIVWTSMITAAVTPIGSQLLTKMKKVLKPLSQLAPDRFKTLCDRKFSNSYILSLPLHDASHLFYATKWSHQVASEFWPCSKFRGNNWRFKSLHWVSRTVAKRGTTLC